MLRGALGVGAGQIQRYDSQTGFQEQNLCHPKTEKTEIYLTTLEHKLLGRPIRLLALIGLKSLTNQIVCFAHTLKVSGDTSLVAS